MEIKQLSDINPKQANEEYINLTNLCYGTKLNSFDNSFIKKHFQSPFGQSYGCWIYDQETLIALNLFMPWEFMFNNNIIKAAQSVDSLVHPAYQGRGLFRKVQELCMEMIPSNVVRFGFPNNMSKPCFLKFGWELSDRYRTKIYPISWLKFAYKRYLLKRKDFIINQPALYSNELVENKNVIEKFFKKIVKYNTTTINYELLSWKLAVNKNLRIKLFKHDSEVIAILIYSIQQIDDYSLLGIFDFIRLEDNRLQHLIKDKLKQFIKTESIDEIQYTGVDHSFLDGVFTAVKSTNADMIIHPQYGNKNDIDFIRFNINISKLVTDHL